MSEMLATAKMAKSKRVVLVTAGMAAVVAIVLISVTRLRHGTPRSVRWEAELTFLFALKIAYEVTASLCLLGTLVLGFLCLRGPRSGLRPRWLARGLALSIALLCSLFVSEVVCAAWISWSHRSTVVPVGGLGTAEPAVPRPRFSYPNSQIDLPSNFPDPPGDRDIDLVVVGGSSAQGMPYERWVSIGKIVAWKLQEAIPNRPIHLNVVARVGDVLEMQHKRLSTLRRRPDLMIIYSGHNEFHSRLWSARNIEYYVSDKRPAPWAALVDRLEQFSPLCVLIRESINKRESRSPLRPIAGGTSSTFQPTPSESTPRF